MDALNRFHTRTTFWIVRAEHIALLLVLTGLLVWHAGEVHWWRTAAAFFAIDIVGYLPGAFMFRRSRTGQIPSGFHDAYNIAHTYLVTGAGVALWAYAIGGFEWAMLAVPIHLSIDRGVFGNTLKPVELSFEPHPHSDETVLRALGRPVGTAPQESAGRGFTVNQLGSKYAESLSSVSLGGSPEMQLRNKIQKARRLGLKVVEPGKDVPWDESWYAKIAEISRLWLENKGKKELDFLVRAVGERDDHDRRVLVVLDGSENPIALISYVPVWGNERPGYLHDLTRRVPDAPRVPWSLQCRGDRAAQGRGRHVPPLRFHTAHP